jgi:hypothetical protein
VLVLELEESPLVLPEYYFELIPVLCRLARLRVIYTGFPLAWIHVFFLPLTY